MIFTLSAKGGMVPSPLVGSVAPRSLHVHRENASDVLYFTGIDKANGLPGVFKVAAAGGAVTTIAEGPPFSDPGGVTVSALGDVYVLDTTGSGSQVGNVIVVPSGSTTATEAVPNLQVGYPAGIALRMDDGMLLASGFDPAAGTEALIEIDLASKAINYVTMGISGYREAAGLHRALTADVFAWADTKASPMGLTGTGTVFVIK